MRKSLEELAKSKNIEFDKLDCASRKEILSKLLREYGGTRYFDNSKFFNDLKFVYCLVYQLKGLDQKITDNVLSFMSNLLADEDRDEIIFLPHFCKVKDKECVFFVSVRVYRSHNDRGYNVITGELIKRIEIKKFMKLCSEISRDVKTDKEFTKEYNSYFINFRVQEAKVSKRIPRRIFNIIKNVELMVKKLNTSVKCIKKTTQKQNLQTQLELLKVQMVLIEKQLESLN